MIVVNWLFEWNGNKSIMSIQYWNHCLILTRSARMEETSMNEIKSIKQYSILISFEHTRMNEVVWHFEDLEYLDQIDIQYFKILSNLTERGQWKLNPPELSMDVRFGRSRFHHFIQFHSYFALSMNMIHHFFHKVHIHRVEWIVMMEDLLKSFHSLPFNTFYLSW